MISLQPSGKSSGRSGDGEDDVELLEWQAYVAGLLEWIGLIGLGSGTHRYGKQEKSSIHLTISCQAASERHCEPLCCPVQATHRGTSVSDRQSDTSSMERIAYKLFRAIGD